MVEETPQERKERSEISVTEVVQEETGIKEGEGGTANMEVGEGGKEENKHTEEMELEQEKEPRSPFGKRKKMQGKKIRKKKPGISQSQSETSHH